MMTTHMGLPIDASENRAKTPPLMIAGLATLGSFEAEPDRAEIAAMYRLIKRMAALARREPFILMADGTTLLVSVYSLKQDSTS